MKKTVQFHDSDRLVQDKELSATQVCEFIETFRNQMSNVDTTKKHISLRVETSLLDAFIDKCNKDGVKYQKQLRKLMGAYILS